MSGLPAELKPRGSWWARLLGDYRAWQAAKAARIEAERQKRKFKHIVTVNALTLWRDTGGWDWGFYNLFENGCGERKVEFTSTTSLLRKEGAPVYANPIVPWLSGRYDADGMREWATKQNERVAEHLTEWRRRRERT